MKKQNNDTEKTKSKNKNKDINSCYVDSVEMSKLNETFQSCMESNHHEKEEDSNTCIEKKESESA